MLFRSRKERRGEERRGEEREERGWREKKEEEGHSTTEIGAVCTELHT